MAKQKFEAPKGNVYGSVIQSTEQQTQPEPATKTEYLTRLIMADMEAHPEWRDTLDILNK